MSRLRDKYIGLASQMSNIVTTAKKEHTKEMSKGRRPAPQAPPAKRATASASAARRFRVVKKWISKQPPVTGVTFMNVATDEVLVAVGEQFGCGWREMERTNGSGERGTVAVYLSAGGLRLVEIEEPVQPEPMAMDAAPMPSSEDEDETGGEEAAAQTEDAFAAAQEEAEEEADFVARVQAEEARAEAARMEADAAECGYDGD